MEYLAEPDLPSPLPRPLSDPLRSYRWILILCLTLFVVAGGAKLLTLLLPDVGKVRDAVSGTLVPSELQQMLALRRAADTACQMALFTILLCTFYLLPRRATNALYLRSFRNDAATGGLRIAAQAALGPAFRLSGIRDPRRRWPALIRHFWYIFFLIRYAQPQYMNLEAGRDWKARLWRSLGEARCALIDVSDLTPFVREEINLAIGCLGVGRVLFIGDDSRAADEWRQAVLPELESPDVPPESIQIAIWADTAAGRTAFSNQVRAFADRLPQGTPGLNPAAFPDLLSSAGSGADAVTGESWWAFWLANLIGLGIAGALIWAALNTPDAGLLWFIPAVIFDALAMLLLVQYLVVCGSRRQRLGIGATLLCGAVLAGLPLFREFAASPEEDANAARGIEVRSNLQQIGEALRQFHDDPLPEAEPTTPGNASQWQLRILPYIEQENQWQQDLDQVPAENK